MLNNFSEVTDSTGFPKNTSRIQESQDEMPHSTWPTRKLSHLISLSVFMQNPCVDGCSQQVIGSGDGMDVPSQVKVELQMK